MTRRANGEGSIYRDADGRWTAKIAITAADGTLRRRRRRAPRDDNTRRAAGVALDGLRAEAGLRLEGGGVTVADFLERWIAHARRSWEPSTAQRQVGIVRNHLIPELGHLALQDVSPQHVQQLLDDKGDELGARSVRYVRSMLRAALEQARRWQMIRDNPADLVPAPPARPREARFLQTADAHRLLEAVVGDPLELLIGITVGVGLRSGEVRGLRWAAVDIADGTLTIDRQLQRVAGAWELRTPKTERRANRVAVPAPLLADLERHRRRQLETRLAAGPAWSNELDLVFTRPNGEPIHGSTLVKRVQAILAELGLEGFTFHDLRHSAASLMLERGVPIESISELLGHADPAFTKRVYAHLTDDLKRDAAARMSGLFERGAR